MASEHGQDGLMKRHLYKTAIGPVCMSEDEHAQYLEALEEMEPDDNEQNRQDGVRGKR